MIKMTKVRNIVFLLLFLLEVVSIVWMREHFSTEIVLGGFPSTAFVALCLLSFLTFPLSIVPLILTMGVKLLSTSDLYGKFIRNGVKSNSIGFGLIWRETLDEIMSREKK